MIHTNLSSSSASTTGTITALLEVPVRLASALANTLAAPLAEPVATPFAGALAASITRSFGTCSSGCCEIPPPCWEPRPAGTCVLALPAGSAARIRLHVMNCDWTRRIVDVTATGRLAAWLKLDPTTLAVGPQETATFLIGVRVPDTAPVGQLLTGPLLVRGCNDHFARIEVRVAECAVPACCDIVVRDCPDHIHHWFDHFYCQRPCQPTRARGVTPPNQASILEVTHG